MAADPVTGYDPADDLDLKEANARFQAAGDEDKANAAQETFTKAAPAQQQTNGLQHWFTNLPQNVGSGLVNAAINTADAAHSAWKWVNEGEADAAAKVGDTSRDQQRFEIPTPEYSDVRNAVQNFKQKYLDVQNPTMSDGITQGIAQFAIPFLGWSKAVSAVGGVGKLAAAGRTVLAEGATAGTAMAPTDGRFADMLDLGRHTEGKFADALNAISPDGSLVNNYIDYMTNRTDESEAEGRMKNIVDTITGGAVISPLIHTGMTMLKGGMAGLKYSLENGVGSIDQLAVPNQEGRIGYHGTPHDFDTAAGFDNSKIGSGEGNQTFGYGHYLAESSDVAKGYQARLTARMDGGSGSTMDYAKNAVDTAGGDKVKAYKQMVAMAADEQSPTLRDTMQRTAALIKSGNYERARGSFITADVADHHVDAMLDWDKPLSEQPGAAKNLSKIGVDPEDESHMAMSGKDIYQSFEQRGFTPQTISRMFDEAGVPGIKYLDGNSRSGGEGTRNLVVFDGKKIDVREKNGKPVRGVPQDMSLTAQDRAAERERVAALRDREDGITREFEPEIIPHRAALSEGEAARRNAQP